MTTTFDLIVIGGGPAGTAAAITAARTGARVLLLERGKYPRQKVCGEFVSAESLGLLAELLDENYGCVIHSAPRLNETRVFLDDRVLRGKIDPVAASIARIDLDEALWRAAQSHGVDARQQQSVRNVDGNGPFTVATMTGEFQARAVINATGRWSSLTATPPNTNGHGHWIGLKGHFAEQNPANSVDLYFFQGGYCGVQPVRVGDGSGPNRVNVCAMVRSNVATKLPEIFELHSALHERSRGWKALTEPVSTSPLFFREPEPTERSILMAGDAAAFVDPFIGDGISLALQSGALAAQCLTPSFAGKIDLPQAAENYRETYRQRLAHVYRNSARIRALLNVPRVIRKPVLAMLEQTPAFTRFLIRKTRAS